MSFQITAVSLVSYFIKYVYVYILLLDKGLGTLVMKEMCKVQKYYFYIFVTSLFSIESSYTATSKRTSVDLF